MRILRGQDSLAGRLSVIELGPLRLSEIIGIRDLGEITLLPGANDVRNWGQREFWLQVCSVSGEYRRLAKTAFECFSELGGYPICHKQTRAPRDDLAEQIVDIVVNRTIDYAERVEPRRRAWDKQLLRIVFRLVCRYMGQSPKPERICSEINKTYRSDVKIARVTEALDYFHESMLVHQVPALEVALKRQSHPPKLCLCDHFVRAASLQEHVPLTPTGLEGAPETVSTVAGRIMDGVVGYYFMGLSGLDVAWFPQRSKEPEVDYVLTIGDRRIPVEVKYTRGKPGASELRGLESFCGTDKYGAKFGLVVTQDTAGPIGDCAIAVPAPILLSLV